MSFVRALESLLTDNPSTDLKDLALAFYKKAQADAERLDQKKIIDDQLVVPIDNVYSRFEKILKDELTELDLLNTPNKLNNLKAAIQSWDPGDLDVEETIALGAMEDFLRETVLDQLYNQQYQQYLRYILRNLMKGIKASTDLLEGKLADLYLQANNPDLSADIKVDTYLTKDPIFLASRTLDLYQQADNPAKNKKIEIINAAIAVNNKLLHNLEEKIISPKPITPRIIQTIEQNFTASAKRNVVSRLHAYDSERSFFQLFIEYVSDTLTTLFNLNRNLSTKGTVVSLFKTDTLLFSASKRKSQVVLASEPDVIKSRHRLS